MTNSPPISQLLQNALLEQARRELERRGKPQLLTFIQWLLELSPTHNWTWPYLVYVIEHLEKVNTGDLRKLMLFLPPRHGKSTVATERFPAYFLECNPARRVMLGAYNSTLAKKFSRRVRGAVRARRKVELNRERQAADDWETVAGGGVRAAGVGGGFTGMGADLIVVDDPVKSRAEADSVAYQEACYDWYTNDIYTRLEPGGAIIIIMTRWNEADLAGRILASEDGPSWTVINLPALAEEDDPLGRAVGEALNPDRYDETALADIKKVLGKDFYALYQQRPQNEEGELFQRAWWQFWTALPPLVRIIQTVDTALKTGERNDYSVIATWGKDARGYYYLIDLWRGRVDINGLCDAIRSQYNKHRHRTAVLAIHIEDKGSGTSAIQILSKPQHTETGMHPALPVIAYEIKSDESKEFRADEVAPLVRALLCSLPKGETWVEDFISEHTAFPKGKHDDRVDTTAMALRLLSSARTATPATGGARTNISTYTPR